MKKRISSNKIRQYKSMRKLATRYESNLYAKINNKRDKVVNKLLESIKGKSISDARKTILKLKNEAYFKNIYLDMYMSLGMRVAKQQNKLIGSGKKAEGDDLEKVWQTQLHDFANKHSGKRIVTLTETLKNDLMSFLDKFVSDAVQQGESIERVTDEIVKLMGDEYKDRRWMARRIAHTETMMCASKAQEVSVDSLGIDYLKVWQITGVNTRPEHQLMQGVAVKKSQPFILPNGDRMMYPQDSSMGASSGNVINCSCFLVYEPII